MFHVSCKKMSLQILPKRCTEATLATHEWPVTGVFLKHVGVEILLVAGGEVTLGTFEGLTIPRLVTPTVASEVVSCCPSVLALGALEGLQLGVLAGVVVLHELLVASGVVTHGAPQSVLFGVISLDVN